MKGQNTKPALISVEYVRQLKGTVLCQFYRPQ